MLRRFQTVLLGLLVLAAMQGAVAQDRVKAIVGATLVDGTGNPPVPDAVVVIRNDRITLAGHRSTVLIPAGAELISAKGKYIIPGLIDGHVHYRSWAGEMFLNHGITTVFDLGNVSEWMVALREGVAKGKIRRLPRIYSSGYALNGPEPKGFSPFSSAIALVKRAATYRLNFTDSEAAMRQVATMLEQEKFDFVKVFEQAPPEMVKAIALETHKHGKVLMGHTDDVYASVNAGMDGVVHLWGVAETTMTPDDREAFRKGTVACPYAKMEPARVDQLIAFLVKRGIYLNPLLAHEHEPSTARVDQFKKETYDLLGDPNMAYVPVNARLAMMSVFNRARNYDARWGNFPYVDVLSPQEREEFRIGYKKAQEFVKKFVAAGGKLWVGTDAGGGSVVPGLVVQEELELLVDAGLTSMQALQAATSIPAQFIGKSEEIGSVQPGRFADFVVLDSDPLQNISNVRKIAMVFQSGELITPGYHVSYALPITNPVETDDTTNAYFPVPRLEDVSPKMTAEGAPGLKLRARGLGFTTRSVLWFHGVALPTRFESATEISAEVPAYLLVSAGTWPVEVSNPAPGGGTSNILGVIVRYR